MPEFNPPSFRKPRTYEEIPASIDQLFEAFNRERVLQTQKKEQDLSMGLAAAKEGVMYDPNNPQAFFEPLIKRKQEEIGFETRRTQLGIQEKEAEIEKTKAETDILKTSKGKLSPAQSSVDRKFGEEYANYVLSGGYAKTVTKIDELQTALDTLKSSDLISGPFVSLAPEFLRARVTPKSLKAQQDVEKSIQSTLKQTLGGQFTAKEGEMFMARGYDPRLPESENIIRVKRLLDELKMVAESKKEAMDYFQENGSMVGFKGKIYTISSGTLTEVPKQNIEKMIPKSEPISQSTKSGQIVERTLKSGAKVKVRQMPDGTWQKVE